jgi:hypothetical protein
MPVVRRNCSAHGYTPRSRGRSSTACRPTGTCGVPRDGSILSPSVDDLHHTDERRFSWRSLGSKWSASGWSTPVANLATPSVVFVIFGGCQVIAQSVVGRLLVSASIGKGFRGCCYLLAWGNLASANLNPQNWTRAVKIDTGHPQVAISKILVN